MRQYLIGSWANADEYDYSGEQLMGNRLGASREVPHFLENGRANVAKYGDNTAKVTKIPLKQRILPQASRVDKLRSEAIELEQAFKAKEFTPEEYTLLREVAFKRLRRAEELLKKAVTPVQREEETYEDSEEFAHETFSPPSDNNGQGGSYSSPVGGSFFAEAIDELSEENLFKSFLKSACLVTRKVIHYKHKISSYLNELKAV